MKTFLSCCIPWKYKLNIYVKKNAKIWSYMTIVYIFGFYYATNAYSAYAFDAYAVLDWANDMKLYIFATKHKADTCYKYFIHSDEI